MGIGFKVVGQTLGEVSPTNHTNQLVKYAKKVFSSDSVQDVIQKAIAAKKPVTAAMKNGNTALKVTITPPKGKGKPMFSFTKTHKTSMGQTEVTQTGFLVGVKGQPYTPNIKRTNFQEMVDFPNGKNYKVHGYTVTYTGNKPDKLFGNINWTNPSTLQGSNLLLKYAQK